MAAMHGSFNPAMKSLIYNNNARSKMGLIQYNFEAVLVQRNEAAHYNNYSVHQDSRVCTYTRIHLLV